MKKTTMDRNTTNPTPARKRPPKPPMPPKKVKARYAARALLSLEKTPSNREVARRVEAWAKSQAAKRPETFGCYRILSAGSLQRLANRLRRAVNDLTARNVPRNEWPTAFVMGFQPKVRAPYRTKKRMLMAQEYIKMFGIPPGTPGVPQEFIDAAAAQRKAAAQAAKAEAKPARKAAAKKRG